MEQLKKFLHKKITEVLEETLENMAFVGIEECSEIEASELKQEMMGVNLMITDPELLEMRLNTSKELLYQIAETMYTMDRDELEEQLINDLLAELLNTLAGRFMSAIIPTETNFSLSIPELAEDEDESTSDLKYYYIAEDYPLSVEIKAADIESLNSLLSTSFNA
ncbi:MAG: chemotaxis protein CheX [Thermodesulfobacteriota bacterium]|nr:chemotaxis protein CheX [Thermodesulfobacteriota bacterium]